MGAGVYCGPPICGAMKGEDVANMCREPRPVDQPKRRVGASWTCPRCGATRTVSAIGEAGPAPEPRPPGWSRFPPAGPDETVPALIDSSCILTATQVRKMRGEE